jgi:DNA-binding MarR family transcriptional regulator
MSEGHGSRGSKAALIQELGEMIVRMQDATQKYDEAVGEVYGLGSAERMCLSLLWSGPKAASVIAREIRLTPAAVTALIDRLEARKYVRRVADPTDRRKVLVEAAEATHALAMDAYLPMAEAGAASLAKRSEAELRVYAQILRESFAIQDQMTRDFLARHNKGSRSDGPAGRQSPRSRK